MKDEQNSKQKLIQNPSFNKNIKITNPPLFKDSPFKKPGNVQKKETSDKTFFKTLTINNQENLSVSKNNSQLRGLDDKVIFFPKPGFISNSSNIKKAKTTKKRKKLDKGKIFKINIENTKKIDYRYYCYYPIKNILPFSFNDKLEEYFWLATYDKLIKKKKLFKIFSFYNIASRTSIVVGNEGIYNDFSKIKEKKMVIKNYELYFIEKHNKPFIRKCEDKYIYTKLYLLSLKQINMIFSYLNRIEYKEYINNLNNLYEKDSYKKIVDLQNNEEITDMNYSAIYCLGTYMNIKIYGFSRIEEEKEKEKNDNNYNIGIDNYPNSKKIAKLIKSLMINFPEVTKEHFINYIFNDSHNNGVNKKMLADKKNEINHLLISKKKSLYKVNSKNNSIMQSIGSGIPEFSFSPYFSSNTYNKNTNTNRSLNILNMNSKTNNNNLGTISYNASYFDFTSDFFNSLKQNDETMSKALDSMRSISNRNWKRKTLFNNYNSNNNSKRIKGGGGKISNFSFENDSKSQHYIKINISDRNNINNEKIINNSNNNNKIKSIKKNDNCKKNNKSLKIKLNKLNSYNIKNKKKNNQSSNNCKKANTISSITQSILEDNKENNNSISNYADSYNNHNKKKVSDFTILKIKNYLNKNKSKKMFKKNALINSSCVNKINLKGEDIFKITNTWNSKNLSAIYKSNIPYGIKSSESKNSREDSFKNKNKNFSISSQLNKILKANNLQ